MTATSPAGPISFVKRTDIPASVPIHDIDGVELWLANIGMGPRRIAELGAALSPAEWERAHRFHFPADRDRHVLARGLLRTLLGIRLGMDAAAVPISLTVHGRPVVSSSAGATGLHFSASHSGNHVLVALSRPLECGVDIEMVTENHEALGELVRGAAGPLEVASLQEMEGGAGWPESVMATWTRKEAVAKALGLGLGIPFRGLEVSTMVDHYAQPRLLRLSGRVPEPGEWTLHHLEPAPGVVGTLAVRGPPLPVKAWALD